jgi:hypothetical protein
MKAIEVRVRKLAGFANVLYALDLMYRAFGRDRALVDQAADPDERERHPAVFASAYAVPRNTTGDHEITYHNPTQAPRSEQHRVC